MPVCKEVGRDRPGDTDHPSGLGSGTIGVIDDGVPVEPWQVHKLDPDEVYLTHWRTTGPDTFRIRARRPSRHPFYRVALGFDPLLLCETVRQTLPLLCHAAYDVPLGHQLIWDRFRYEIDDAAYAGIDRGPELELEVHCFDLSFRGKYPSAVSLRAEVSWGGVRVAVAETRFTVQSRAVYQRLRGPYADVETAAAKALPAPAAAPSAGTGRTRAADVVLASPADGGRQLRANLDHPIYFDHPVDHMPGMVLLEAAHQAVGGNVSSLDCSFHRYVELDTPCTIVATPPDTDTRPADHGGRTGRSLRITAIQDSETRFTADIVAHAAPVREDSSRAVR